MWSEKVAKLITEYQKELPPYAFPGGYPLYYVDDSNNNLCPSCAQAEKDGENYTVVNYEINWEDEDLYCDECGLEIQCAYSDDDNDDAPEMGDSPEWLDLHMGDDE